MQFNVILWVVTLNKIEIVKKTIPIIAKKKVAFEVVLNFLKLKVVFFITMPL